MNYLFCVFIIKGSIGSIGSCPSSHKFTYLQGKYCCRTNKEKNDPRKDGKFCDGGYINFESRCCENNAYIKCAYPYRCDTHRDGLLYVKGDESVFS